MRVHLRVSLTKSKTGLVKEEKGYVVYANRQLSYTILTNKRLKNLYIEIHPTKGVLVKNPSFPLYKVQEIVNLKAKWIFEKSSQLQERNSIQKIYESEAKFLLFGEKISLHVKVPLDKFYKEKTQEIVLQIIKEYSAKMQLYPTRVGFRKAKKRWGSCSGKDELSFNTSIAQLPLMCIEYIVVHELAHIKHKHHQQNFWKEVQKYIPNYKECEKIIKDYSPAI